MAEWEAYDQLEPIGGQWQQTALLASLIANANRDLEQHPEPFRLEEFLPVSVDVEMEDPELEEDPTTAQGNAPHQMTQSETALMAGEPEPEWMTWKRGMQLMAEATSEEK